MFLPHILLLVVSLFVVLGVTIVVGGRTPSLSYVSTRQYHGRMVSAAVYDHKRNLVVGVQFECVIHAVAKEASKYNYTVCIQEEMDGVRITWKNDLSGHAMSIVLRPYFETWFQVSRLPYQYEENSIVVDAGS